MALNKRNLKNTSVYIKHADKLDSGESFELQSMLEKFMGKLRRMSDANMLSVNVDAHKSTGNRKKYSMKASLHDESRVIRSNSNGWDLSKTTNELIIGLRKQIIKKNEMRRILKKKKKRLSEQN